MSARIFVLRPEPGLTSTHVTAFDHGLRLRGMPLAKVEAVAWRAPAEAFDGLLVGSANAIRHGGAELDKVRHLPVLAVGEMTAQAAREAGFAVERVGEGGLQQLLDSLGGQSRRLLRLAGESRVALSPAENIVATTVVCYAVRYLTLVGAQAAMLDEGGIVLLHSGDMARHFAQQCEALGLDRSRLALVAMSARVAQQAGNGWQAVHIAPSMNDAAMLEIAASLCQTGGGDGAAAQLA
ncbi:uroporphyrinogen-III synthase [Parerythrobacter aurantius]|uniref:uroporphyrinogen-III synthase n=1 Tax=Parerythrobacter aurantius TaxID=3127706 RepID=UPI00324FC207